VIGHRFKSKTNIDDQQKGKKAETYINYLLWPVITVKGTYRNGRDSPLFLSFFFSFGEPVLPTLIHQLLRKGSLLPDKIWQADAPHREKVKILKMGQPHAIAAQGAVPPIETVEDTSKMFSNQVTTRLL